MRNIGWSPRARSRLWMLVVTVLAVCGGLIPAAAVPAHASATELAVFWHADRTLPWHEVVLNSLCDADPQMARNSYNTGAEITCLGPGNSLWFWSINDGTWSWTDEEVAGYGSAYSDPAITTNSAGTEIAVKGPNNSLWFYWNINGSPTWNAEQVAGPGSTYSAPAITDSGNATEISASAPDGSLWFYWATHGSSTWNAEEAGGPGADSSLFAPAMVLTPLGTAEIAVIAYWSPLWVYRQGLFGGWSAEEVTSTAVEYKPWITRSATGTEITANIAGYIYTYFNTDGSSTWTLEFPSTNRIYQGLPITRDNGGTEIAANGYDGSLSLFSNTDGSSAWSMEQVGGPGTVYGAGNGSWPAIVRYPSHGVGQFGGTEIAAIAEP